MIKQKVDALLFQFRTHPILFYRSQKFANVFLLFLEIDITIAGKYELQEIVYAWVYSSTAMQQISVNQ